MRATIRMLQMLHKKRMIILKEQIQLFRRSFVYRMYHFLFIKCSLFYICKFVIHLYKNIHIKQLIKTLRFKKTSLNVSPRNCRR